MVSSYQRSSSANNQQASSSTSSGSAGGASQGSNRLCAQCRNHGLRVPVRGHKRYCAYRLCTCRDCKLVRERQRVVALHLYVRRAQEQEEEAQAAAEMRSEQSTSAAPAPPESVASRVSPAAASPETLHQARNAEIANADLIAADTRERMLYESLIDLNRLHRVSQAGLPLLLCILKSSRSVHEAYAKIAQGTHDVSAMGLPGLEAFTGPTLYM